MDTFGDRLRSERNDRGLSIRDVAEILRCDQDRLLALERNDFEALPDEAVMRECLHAYAECLEVDADLMIEDYLRERESCSRRVENAVLPPVAATAAAGAATGARPPRRSFTLLAALVVVAIAILAAWWMLSREETAPTPERPAVADAPDDQPRRSEAPPDTARIPVDVAPAAEAPPIAPSDSPTPTPEAPPTARSAPTTAAESMLSVLEHAVGSAVENRRLTARSDRFTEGAQVTFWTRVRSGDSGDTIEHVWLREGVEVTRISLNVRGWSWRTYSSRTLQAGEAGAWAVEARDDGGRVLARSEFVCLP